VIGEAAEDPDFNDQGSVVRYSVSTGAAGPFHIEAELWYQPIGFRWGAQSGTNITPQNRNGS